MGRGPTFNRDALLAAYGAAQGRSTTARIAAAAATAGCSAGTMQRAISGAPGPAAPQARRGKRPTFTPVMIETAWNAAVGPSKSSRLRAAAQALGCTPATVTRFLRRHSGVGRASSSPSGPAAIEARKTLILAVGHPATVEARTLFPTTVRDVAQERLLKDGEHSGKIGRRVRKGAWKGFPIFTLTLEERATCPTSCRHWGSCYGNNMPMARRWRHGEQLEWRLRREVAAIELDNPAGFVVRLHSLGDFYSIGYVAMWRELLERHAALHVFGYTAHVEPIEDVIAYELALLVRDYWTRLDPPRFAVRFSNAPVYARSTITLEVPSQRPADAVICPAQWTPSGKKAQACATCALCWGSTKRVAFLQH
jgi:hypothetical protein